MNKYLYDRNKKFKFSILKSKFFWCVLTLKIIASCLFASDYLTDLFYPFISFFVNNDLNATYTFFNETGQTNSFPYPVLMLYLTSFFKVIFSNDDVLSFIDILIIRIPVLIADISILLVLSRWLKFNLKEVLIYYWLNPILIYINYLHGQLDVIPTAFLMISLYFLFKNKWFYSSLFIAFSILCKTNFIVAFPFLLIYYLKSNNFNYKHILYSILVFISIIFLFHVPVLFNFDYFNIVYNNSTQSELLNLALVYKNDINLSLYIAPGMLLLMIFYGLTFKSFNKNLFILFICFCFASITIFTSPGQGWYYWFIPFQVFFIIKQKQFNKLFYWLFIFGYFLYFSIIPDSDFLSINFFSPYNNSLYDLIPLTNELKNIFVSFAFTFLQITLLVNIIFILINGIEEYKKNKLLYQPLIIGIGGDSGSGKTTFTNSFSKLFGRHESTIIRGDDMHKWERGDNNWSEFTHLNPEANYIHKEIEFLKFLKKGVSINRRYYDHTEGKFTMPKKIKSKRIILYEGLHPFYLSEMKKSFDIKIFMEPDESLRRKWKIERDTKKRGYTEEKIIDQMESRKKDSEKYIKTQSLNSDFIISFNQLEDTNQLILDIKINNNIDIESFLIPLSNFSNFHYKYKIDQSYHYLSFNTGITKKDTEYVAYLLLPDLEDIISIEPKWESEFNGIIQLIQLLAIKNSLKSE